MKKALILGVTVCAFFARAQQVPRPEEYQQAVRILQGEPASGKPALAAKTRAKQAGSVPVIQGEITGGAIQVQRQAPLPNNAKLALALSADWLNSGSPPTVGSGGRVVYVYGQGVPTVVCSLLQVCELDLEPGEKGSLRPPS